MRLATGLAFYALAFLIIGLAVGFMFDVGRWLAALIQS